MELRTARQPTQNLLHVSYQSISLAINSCLEDHFIVRVPDLRPPEEMHLDWLYQCGKLCQEFVNCIRRKTVSQTLLRALQYIFIF